MAFYMVKMDFQSPVRIGPSGGKMEESRAGIYSDTLYSALFQSFINIYGEVKEGFKVSSAFPYVLDAHYLPKPSLRPPGFEDAEIRETYGKTVKKAAFVEWDLFNMWVSNEQFDFEKLKEYTEKLDKYVKSEVRPRVSLDRVSSSSMLYHVGETFFSEGSGLFFLVECSEDFWPEFKAAVMLLGDEGIGGERTQGYGRFVPHFSENAELPGKKGGTGYISLSLMLPEGRSELDHAVSYALLYRSGWLGSNASTKSLKHKGVYMLAEGSVFSERVKGKIEDVSPQSFNRHPVYRNGRAFCVGADLL